MVQAYIDESGGKGQTNTFVFSALIAEAEEWARKADEWDAALKKSPSIGYFKMDEAVGLDGQFYGLSASKRDEKLKDLCRVIRVPSITELSVTIRIDDFLTHWAPRLGKPASEPYFFAFQGVHLGVGFELLSRNHTERCEVFFDEHKIFGPRARVWYPVICRTFPREIQAILPVDPFFRDDAEVLPLQAADLTAWIQRKFSSEGNLGEFEWLLEELRGIRVSPCSKIIDAEWIADMLAHKYTADELSRNADVPKAYKDNFGFEWPPKTKPEKKRHSGR
jgi:Protein of unknown function (DUF3800)